MNHIYFSEYSIGRFPIIILCLIVIIIFIIKKSKSTPTRCILITFISFFLFNLGYFIAYTLYNPLGSWGWYITAFGSFGPIAFIQFVYRFPSYYYKRESRVVFFISSAAFIFSVIDYCFYSIINPVLSTSTHFGSLYASRFMPAYWVLSNIWLIILSFRQSRRIGIEHSLINKRPFKFLQIFFPNEKLSKASRNIALLIMFELSLSLTTALFMSLNITSLSTFNMITSAGMLIVCLLYVVVYINNSPKANTLIIKLTAISMVVIFLVLGGMSNLVMSIHNSTYTETRKTQLSYISQLIGNQDAVFPKEIKFIITSNDFRKPENIKIIYTSDIDFKISEPLRFWEKPPSIRNLNNLEVPGSGLFDDSGILKNKRYYTQINNQMYFYFTFQKDNLLYGVGYDFIHYRKYMHNRAIFLLLIIFFVSLLCLIIYPVLFFIGLVIPLNNLLNGVRKVDSGDLDVNIPIQFMDEIGYLSGLFNKMVTSIREKNKSLNDYAANLELKVIERTRELEKGQRLLYERNKIIENDLELARNIQQGLIPKVSPVKYISLFYKPMEQVGGDFYDIIHFADSNKIGLFICDVSGHGVPAAFITSMIKTAILQSGERKDNPAELLSYINDLLQNQTDGNFITAFYGIYNQNDRKLLYANAGHPQPYIINVEGIMQLSKGKSTALALFPNTFLEQINKPYRTSEEILPVNSKLLLYTDGLTEATPLTNYKLFEYEKMNDVFYGNRTLSSSVFITKLYESLITFRGDTSFDDDISLICLEVL